MQTHKKKDPRTIVQESFLVAGPGIEPGTS